MKEQNLKEKYEEFHKNAGMQTKIIDNKNFTYHIVLSFIDKYLHPDMKVLDIGCGVGTISLYIANKGNEVLGTDISEKAIKAAQRSAELLGIKNASFTTTNFLDTNFQEKFDFVVCIGVLEHITNDALAMEKMYKLLKIGGKLVLLTPLETDPMHKVRLRFFGKDEFDIRVGHLRRYSKQRLVQLLESNGFKVIEIFLTEGFLRMFLFTTKAGNRLLMFASLPMGRSLLTLLDNLSAYLLGASQIFIVAEVARKGAN